MSHRPAQTGDIKLEFVKVDGNDKEVKDPENVDPPLSKKQQYKQNFVNALHQISIRGLSKAMTAHTLKFKIYWSFIFIFAIVVFSINLKNIIIRYKQEPILTQLEREDLPFTWPHFTICNPANPIPFWNNSKLDKWLEQLSNAETMYSLPKYDPRKPIKIWEHYMAISTINPEEFYKNLVRQSIYKMSVIYEDSSIVEYSSPIDLYEDVKNFEEAFDIRMLTIRSPIACFTLQPDKLRDIVKALSTNHTLIGIKLYLLMDVQSYLQFDMGFENRKTYFYVTNPNSTILSKFPNYIMPGTDTTLLLRQDIHKRVSSCTKKSFAFELFDISMSRTFLAEGSFEDCRSFASQREFVNQCGCYNPYLPIYKFPNRQPKLCTNMTIFDNQTMNQNIDCLNHVLKTKKHLESFTAKVEEECSVYHQNPCVESIYAVRRYTTTWQETMSDSRRANVISGSKALPNAPENGSEIFPRENLAIVKMEWSREKTQATFEQYSYPLSRFMSDFGGIVGLWIGLSIFSLFEILEIIFRFFKYIRMK